MSGDEKDMTDMKPIRRKGSLLERADKRFDFGNQLRRIEPGSVDGGVLEGRAVNSRTAPADGTAPSPAPAPIAPVVEQIIAPDDVMAPPVAPAAPHNAAAAPAAPVAMDAPAPISAPAPVAPVSAVAPVAPMAPVAAPRSNLPARNRRFVPTAPMQPIDRQILATHGLIDPDGTVGSLAEEFRIIKRQLMRASAAVPHGRRILITSSQPDEGKTFSAVNLALSLAAEKDVSVLLIDGDFARSEVPGKLGITPGLGLMDALADPAISIAQCVIPTDNPRLVILPSGSSTNAGTELLGSARMAELLDILDADAPDRIILFDSMPLLAASSAGTIAAHCGQVLVVVRADVTREAALRDSIGLIGQHNGISLLLNRVRFTPEGRRFGSYYGEGG
ncbi:MAG: capsular biosynthesis protein [Sphingopyxis sp.]